MARVSGTPETGAWTVQDAEPQADGTWRLTLTGPDGRRAFADAVVAGPDVWIAIDGVVRVVPSAPAESGRRRSRASAGHGLEAPMPATVTRIVAQVGQRVAAGDTLLLLEAMKMELAIRAPHAGTVTRIACEPGALVQPGVPLVELE
jgi:biotin carboxyl carrier protein